MADLTTKTQARATLSRIREALRYAARDITNNDPAELLAEANEISGCAALLAEYAEALLDANEKEM